MGLYARYVLPRLIDRAMSNRISAAERARLVPTATGVVLEVGAGSALNVPHYGAAVQRLYALDPSTAVWRLGRERVRRAPFPVEFLEASAERVPLDAGSVDTVVSTWTLCSIPDAAAALAELRRVLRPGGAFLFVEHGRSPDPRVQVWQRRLDPLWARVAGGCHVDRPIDRLIAGTGFDIAALERGYSAGPRPFSYLYRGTAHPRP